MQFGTYEENGSYLEILWQNQLNFSSDVSFVARSAA